MFGNPQRMDWDLNGDGSTEVSCPGDYSTLHFRRQARAGTARAAALTGSVSVRAVDASGAAGAAVSQTYEVAPPRSHSANVADLRQPATV